MTKKMEELLGKTVIAKNETCWDSQLKMVRQRATWYGYVMWIRLWTRGSSS